MLSNFHRLMEIRMGGGVERCHTVRHTGSYSVASHSWGVAVLMLILWPADFPRLALYCLSHDVPEAWVGDIPAPMKKFAPPVKVEADRMETQVFRRLGLPNDAWLQPDDKAKLRACDSLELYLWAREQLMEGNAHASCLIRELEGFFFHWPLLPEAQTLLDQIKTGSVQYDLGPGYRALYPGS